MLEELLEYDYFFCTDADDMYYKELADKVRYFKKDQKGVESMCRVMENMRNETAWKTKVESVLRWLAMGLSHEQIAEGEGLTVEQIREIERMKKA